MFTKQNSKNFTKGFNWQRSTRFEISWSYRTLFCTSFLTFKENGRFFYNEECTNIYLHVNTVTQENRTKNTILLGKYALRVYDARMELFKMLVPYNFSSIWQCEGVVVVFVVVVDGVGGRYLRPTSKSHLKYIDIDIGNGPL